MDFAKILSWIYVGSNPASIEYIEGLRRNRTASPVVNLQTNEHMSAIGMDFKPLEAHSRTSPIRLFRVPMKE